MQLQPSSRLETADIRSRPLRESCSGNGLLSLVGSRELSEAERDASVSCARYVKFHVNRLLAMPRSVLLVAVCVQ